MEGNMWVLWNADKCSKSLVGLHTWQQLIGIWVFWTQNQWVYWGYMISLYSVHLYICLNVTLWPQNMYSQVSIKNYINSPSLSPQRSRWQAVLYSLGRVLPFSLWIGFRLQCWKDSGGLNPGNRSLIKGENSPKAFSLEQSIMSYHELQNGICNRDET